MLKYNIMFLLEAHSTRAMVRLKGLGKLKISSDLVGIFKIKHAQGNDSEQAAEMPLMTKVTVVKQVHRP
jgi:hypothetical protein